MTLRDKDKRPQKKRRPPVRTSREEIQEKSMELFMRKGYHGMSTTDLCEALGISRPTLYWYFKSKEEILFAVHKARIDSLIKPILEQAQKTSDPVRRLQMIIHELTTVACLHPETRVLINETAYLAPEHSHWVRLQWADVLDTVRSTLHELRADGKIKECSETFSAFSLIGMILWTFNWFDHTKPQQVGELTKTIEEIFFSGLLKSGTS